MESCKIQGVYPYTFIVPQKSKFVNSISIILAVLHGKIGDFAK